MCGPCATRHREPCQAGNRAALSGLPCVPQTSLHIYVPDIFCFIDFFEDFFIMKNFKARFMELIRSISGDIVFGSFIATVIFQIFCVFLFLIGQKDFFNITVFYLVFDVVVIISVIFLKAVKNPESIYKLDIDITGNNFAGFSKKDRSFRKAFEVFVSRYYGNAVNMFKDIDEKYNLSDSEKGVLYFYIARCYHIMEYYTNAMNYYEKAEKAGFTHHSLMLFEAGCNGNMGDTETALKMYQKYLNPDDEYFIYIKTHIGKMYLDNRNPEEALKWFLESVEERKNYAVALGGCSLAYLMLGDNEKSKKYYQYAIINHMDDIEGFKAYYREISEGISLKGSDSVV